MPHLITPPELFFDFALEPETLPKEEKAVEDDPSSSKELDQDDTPVTEILSKLRNTIATLIDAVCPC